MTHKQSSKQAHIRCAISIAILAAILVSTFKLWEASVQAIGTSVATYTVPAFFCVFAILSHFAGNALSSKAQRSTLAVTYLCKGVTSLALSIAAKADVICATVLATQTAPSCAVGAEAGQLFTVLVALASSQSPYAIVSVLTCLCFMLLGDLFALGFECLHRAVNTQSEA